MIRYCEIRATVPELSRVRIIVALHGNATPDGFREKKKSV